MIGLCQCGYGERTRIAYKTRAQCGWKKGEPLPFIAGHRCGRTLPPLPPDGCRYISLPRGEFTLVDEADF